MKVYHPYHLVNNSPWPLLSSFIILSLASSFILYLNQYITITPLLFITLVLVLILYLWWHNVILEGSYTGYHTLKVQQSLNLGFYLFLFSEVIIFGTLFLALFWYNFDPSIAFGNIWPPIGINKPNPLSIPLLNTLILLLSGVSITWSHHAFYARNRLETIIGLIVTILCGIVFTYYQIYEYYHSSLTISEGYYGSIFYLLTGLHGVHVFIGTSFLLICLIRLLLSHFSVNHSLGLNYAIIYWHFVDVIWLFVFVFVYLL